MDKNHFIVIVKMLASDALFTRSKNDYEGSKDISKFDFVLGDMLKRKAELELEIAKYCSSRLEK